jgi:hypothetical protein
MFNVYLPKLLETGSSDETSTKSLEDSLWDVLIFTLGGCPGAIVRCFIALFDVSLNFGCSSELTWWRVRLVGGVR